MMVAALKEARGYFVWRDSDGEEYVIMSRREVDQRAGSEEETQLGLLNPVSADDMLNKINHDLALYQLQREEEENGEDEIADDSLQPLPPLAGKKVKFEPLRGDLPPDLQE